MNAQTDSQLLRAYAEDRSEAAFAEIVRRHVDFVYSAARRMVCDSHLAEDVTQSVFLALAKSAAQLAERPVLSGWLHRTAQNIAAQTVRTIERRRAREQEAATMNELLAAEPDTMWESIAPHLDAALGELSESDRDAVLLRYFERKSAHEMAQTLGITAEAAQKRVSRAMERLREFFAKRGVTVSASGLIVVISADAVQAAPVGLAATISTAAALTGTTIATTATATAAKAIAMTTLQKTLVTATVAVLAGAGIYEARQAAQLREQVETLQQRQAPLTEQIEHMSQALADATNRIAGFRDEDLRLNRNNTELLRLRAETGMLRQQTNRLGKLVSTLSTALNATNTTPALLGQTNFSRESWVFAGFGTPEDTLKSFMWAKSCGDVTTAFATTTPELGHDLKEFYFKNKTDAEISAILVDSAAKQMGFQIMNKLAAADDQVIFQVHVEGAPLKSYALLTLRNIGGEWKVSSCEERNDEPAAQ